jgi:hypothetical protein
MTDRPDTDEEIIAAALLMGATFERTGQGGHLLRWRCVGANSPFFTGNYANERDAAVDYLRRKGYELNFNGQLTKA